MKNKKTIFGIVILIVIAIIVSLIVYYNSTQISKQSNEDLNINISELNSKILSGSDFDEMQMQDISKDLAANMFEINQEDIKNIVGKTPLIGTKSSMYVLVEPADNKANEIKNKLETYAKEYESQWSNYLEDQHELVTNRKIGIKGNIVYMFIADNAESLVSLIK